MNMNMNIAIHICFNIITITTYFGQTVVCFYHARYSCSCVAVKVTLGEQEERRKSWLKGKTPCHLNRSDT